MAIQSIAMVLGGLVFLAWVVWIILEWKKLKYKDALQNRLIGKFNTAAELNHFLQSNGGNKFMSFLTIEGIDPKEKLISSISKGVIFSIVGIAFIIIGPILLELTEEIRIFQALGIISIALGIGFLVSSFISYLLRKNWGIIDVD
jgi:hypothetical protein